MPEQHGISHSNMSLFRYESVAGGEGSTDAAPEMFTHCPNHTDVGLLTIIPAAQGSSGLNVFSWDSAGTCILRAQHGTAAPTSDRDSTTPLALNPTISIYPRTYRIYRQNGSTARADAATASPCASQARHWPYSRKGSWRHVSTKSRRAKGRRRAPVSSFSALRGQTPCSPSHACAQGTAVRAEDRCLPVISYTAPLRRESRRMGLRVSSRFGLGRTGN